MTWLSQSGVKLDGSDGRENDHFAARQMGRASDRRCLHQRSVSIVVHSFRPLAVHGPILSQYDYEIPHGTIAFRVYFISQLVVSTMSVQPHALVAI
jgi:hypothetical protein